MRTVRMLLITGLTGIGLLASLASQARVNWSVLIAPPPPPAIYLPRVVVPVPPTVYYEEGPDYDYPEPRIVRPVPPPPVPYWREPRHHDRHDWRRDHDRY